MPNEIRTDITVLDKNTQNIEQKLQQVFKGEIIRWAVVCADNSKIKVCCSYKK
jgi:hypothetical protein